jgi:hypothetical protein
MMNYWSGNDNSNTYGEGFGTSQISSTAVYTNIAGRFSTTTFSREAYRGALSSFEPMERARVMHATFIEQTKRHVFGPKQARWMV